MKDLERSATEGDSPVSEIEEVFPKRHPSNAGHGKPCVNPGGLVTFGPSYIAANTIAEDYGIDKWWKEPAYITEARKKGYFGDYEG